MKRIFIIVLMFLNYGAWGKDICADPALGKIPVLADGRVKPLSVHATEFSKKVLANTCGMGTVEYFCQLSMGTAICPPKIKVDHKDILEKLNLKSHEVMAFEIEPHFETLRQIYTDEEQAGRKDSGLALAAARILTGVRMIGDVKAGEDWKVYTEGNWVSLASVKTENISEILFKQKELLPVSTQDSLYYEIILQRFNPFLWAIFVGLMAFVFSIAALKVPRFYSWAFNFSVFLAIIQIVGMTLRVLVSGRSPVTNMYETVMWTGFGVLSFGLIFSYFKKEIIFLAFATASNVIALFMMKFATGMLDESIRPLVPVLRDNFWLSTHVTTVTLSYATFLLSWLMANTVLIGSLVNRVGADFINKMNEGIRVVIQVGTVMLAAGIILGGVWADYSWGRFWGWDPKETWSLIALMIYMIILHGRYAGWFRGFKFTLCAAGGFLFVLMAWFGVNYILASGLHSYGFSNGGAMFLFTVFAVQILIMALAFLKQKSFLQA